MTDEIVDIKNLEERIEKGFKNGLITEESYLLIKTSILILKELKEIKEELKPYWKK